MEGKEKFMDVRNCRQCGKMYNYIGGPYRHLCPDCIRELEDKFMVVKEYISENKSATMVQISEACDVSTKQIEQWVRDERLFFTDDSPIGLECENCGATIKTGRYCDACKGSMANKLDSLYSKKGAAVQPKKDKDTSARMRFLDM
jgi:flagellar operon protein (TIGR03826 family)